MTHPQLLKLPAGPFLSANEIAAGIDPWRAAGIDTGDARYLVVAEILDTVASEFNERGAILWDTNKIIWTRWHEKLPEILDTTDALTATGAAQRLLDEIRDLLARPWFKSTGRGDA
jgi:hypothetical protein